MLDFIFFSFSLGTNRCKWNAKLINHTGSTYVNCNMTAFFSRIKKNKDKIYMYKC